MKERIVIVDDCTSIRDMMEIVLSGNCAYEVIGKGATGIDALALCINLRPDLLILELMLPVVCGIEVMHRLRAERKRPRLLGRLDADYISKAVWSPDGTILAIETGTSIHVWRRGGKRTQFKPPKYHETIYTLAVSDTGLAVATSEQVRFYDLTGDTAPVRVANLSDKPLGMALSPNGKTLAVGVQQGRIDGFKTATGKRRWSVEAGDEWISSLYLTDSGMVGVVLEDELSVYEVGKGKRLAHLRSENRWGECWMPEGANTVLAGGSEGELHRLTRKDSEP